MRLCYCYFLVKTGSRRVDRAKLTTTSELGVEERKREPELIKSLQVMEIIVNSNKVSKEE